MQLKRFLFLLISIGTLFLSTGCGGGGGSSSSSSDTIAPNFISKSTVSVEEGETDVITVHAEDTSTVTYSISGGNDSSEFSINSTSGLLEFKTAPDYDNPADSDEDNDYEVTVTATDSSSNQSQQHITVSVTKLDADTTAPNFTSDNTVSVEEGETEVITVHAEDTSTVTYSITGGNDSSEFSINSDSGLLTFDTAPDYDSPADHNEDNDYEVTVTATDSSSNQSQQHIIVSVTDLDEVVPIFTTESNISVEERQFIVITVHAEDTSAVTYSITGGSDSTKFSIDSTSGLLTFKTAPDYETPTDSNEDNNYTLTVTATDTSNNLSQQDLIVTVTDLNELNVDDNDFDYIPDDIEAVLGTNPNNNDENNNNIDDGLDTEGTYGDTFFDKQWHIRSLGSVVNDSGVKTIVGNDLDLLDVYHSYMGYNQGNNIIVQVVDTGIDADHEDLENNMDLTRSYDGVNVGDPSSNESGTHGTEVAGIMAAEAFNGKGVRGIAPFAKIAGSNWLETQGTIELDKVWYSGVGANEIAVSNNSWGSYFDTDTLYEEIMALGTANLRSGKGRIYVFAAGNDRTDNGNANLQYSLSNRYMIAVAALKHDNTHASYSTPGSNILVSGYSGDYASNSPTIGTTTIMGMADNSGIGKDTWSEDINENYTYAMNGTSAASPTVAASIALVLEACPNLTWRDVKYLTAKHAKQVDASNETWVKNSAGLWHSIDYGFGLINPKGIIEECSAGSYNNLSTEQNSTVTRTINTFITDDNTPYSFIVNMPNNLEIEWIEVTVDSNSTYASDYKVELRSPQGTRTTLMTEKSQKGGSWMNGGFRLSTAAMIGEPSQGDWNMTIRDTWDEDNGTLKNIELKIYGH